MLSSPFPPPLRLGLLTHLSFNQGTGRISNQL